MNYLAEILSLVEAAVSGDRKRGTSYANLLADKLVADGNEKAAARIRRAIDASPLAKVTAADAQFERDRMPVDSESRLSLADEISLASGEAEAFLDDGATQAIEEFISYVQAQDLLVADGVGIDASLLLYGPPGTGKTEIARSIALRLRLPLITARVDTLISSFLGSTSKNIRLLFDHVAERRCVLFLDELDALAKIRDDRQELGELKRVVVSLLQNIDVLPSHTVLIAATNHDHLLDPAVWRRFAYRVKIDLPRPAARRAMFAKFLANHTDERDLDRYAKASEGLSGSDIKQLSEASRRAAIVAGLRAVPSSEVLRRLLTISTKGEELSIPQLISHAKSHLPGVYTHRVLADMFDMSPGNITHLLKKAKRRVQHE